MTRSDRPFQGPLVDDLPSDTNLRFVLLMLSVVAASTFIHLIIYHIPGVHGEEYRTALAECAAPAFEDLQSVSHAEYVSRSRTAWRAVRACRAPAEYKKLVWLSACLTLLFASAAFCYWAMPFWRLRAQRLKRISEEDGPDMWNALTAMVHDGGLRSAPVFVIDPYDRSDTGALAFGSFGKAYVKLGVGLATRFYTDPPAFRAIVLHELAHIRNADIGKSYFSVALLGAFGVLGLAPLVASFVFASAERWLEFSWRSLALVALVIGAGAALLRARELYADARVREWGGATDLRRVLASMKELKTWQRILHVHPTPTDRIARLTDPSLLGGTSFWEALAVGLATAVLYENTKLLVDGVLMDTAFYGEVYEMLAIAFVPFAIGIVGVGVWRAVALSLLTGARSASLFRSALGVALGIVVGEFTSYHAALGLQRSRLSFYSVVWLAIVFTVVYVGLRWLAIAARAWREVPNLTRRQHVLAQGASVAATSLFVATCFGWVSASRSLWNGNWDFLIESAYVWITSAPLSIFLLFGWSYLLVARLLASRAAVDGQARRDVGSLLRTAIVGGALYSLVLLAVRIAVQVSLPDDVLASNEFNRRLTLWRMGGAILAEVLIASVVARRVSTLPVVHGVAAAHCASVVIAAGWLSVGYLVLGTGGATSFSYAWFIYMSVAHWGLVPVAIAANLAARRARRLAGTSLRASADNQTVAPTG